MSLEIPKHAWSGAAATAKPRTGVLACMLLLSSPRYHIELARECSECDLCFRYLKRTSQRVGRICYLPVLNIAIDRHKNLQLAASSRRALMLNSPTVFRRIVKTAAVT